MTTTFDALGRTLTATTADNAVVTSSYSSNTVTATDQTGKKRKSITDALGRLKEIYEDPTGLNYQTNYSYDVLDNLTIVTQGTQTRTFVYDSLKRPTSATNPESGTVNYQYDNSGNLTQRTDSRGIVSTYQYDALNRNTNIDYSDATLDVVRQYDQAVNGKGLINLTTQSGSTTSATYIDEYDALGRLKIQRQRFETSGVWSDSYQVQRSYNLAGAVVSQTYPSGRSVTYSYDSAGRTDSVSGTLGDSTNRTYSTGILYSPCGGLSKEQFGTATPIYNKLFYNSRGQLAEIREGTTYTGPTDGGWERGAIINHYSAQCWGACSPTSSMTDNNGNLKQQDHWIPDGGGGVQALYVQNYDYDTLNRLQRVREGSWQQEYVYDRWGNRTVHQTNTYGTGIPKPNFGVDTTNNRLTAPGGYSMTYDVAGNLTNDTYTGVGNRIYDAENRMTQAWGGNNQWQYYTYDGTGLRTRRKIDGTETWQIYGFNGELLAEYPANGAPGSSLKEYGYRNGELLVTATGRTNYALATNGATATASSTYSGYPFSPGAAIDGEHKGLNWLNGGGWHGSTATFPQWLEVTFNGNKTIDEIGVFTVQDNAQNPSEPTEAMTFSLYGLTGYDVQYWNGSSWVTVTGGNVTGNNKVWKRITFAPISTNKIRVVTNASIDGWSRLTER